MAATRLIPLHVHKGHTMHQCIKDRTDYAENGEKTDGGKYISSYECTPETVDLEFAATKTEYEINTGREPKQGDVAAYMIRQSFKPGEITPEEANAVGYETAMRWTKGKHAFIVATHTDKAHIHNHIIYNSTTLDAEHKYRNFMFSAIALRRLSDLICLEHGLSVIAPKQPSEWQKRTTYPKRKTYRDEIKELIVKALEAKPNDFEDFLNLLSDDGCEVKHGKYIAVKLENQKKYIRLKSLGDGYTEADIINLLQGGGALVEPAPKKQVDLLVDIQSEIAKKKGPGFENWAKLQNIKRISKSLMFLHDKGIRDYDDLDKRVDESQAKYDEIKEKLKTAEARLSEITEVKTMIINYMRTKNAYAAYKKSGFSKKFFEANREALTLMEASKKYFNGMGGHIPKLKELNVEYASVLAEKRELYSQFKQIKPQMQELMIAKANIDSFLRQNDPSREFEKKKNRNAQH